MKRLGLVRLLALPALLVALAPACHNQSGADAPGAPCRLGERKPAEDGCNTCTCTEQGWACTELGCVEHQPRLEPAAECSPGETRQEECNQCVCNDDGTWGCTELACR